MHAHLTALFVLELFDPIIHLPLQLHASKQPQGNSPPREISPPGGEGISMSRKIPPPPFSSLG
jgi:hypothetical protein